MKKVFWVLLLAALVACGPATTDSQPAVQEQDAFNESEAPETTESAESSSSFSAATDLTNFNPVESVEEAAVVRAQDWTKGPAEPLVVIIEYSDFQ